MFRTVGHEAEECFGLVQDLGMISNEASSLEPSVSTLQAVNLVVKAWIVTDSIAGDVLVMKIELWSRECRGIESCVRRSEVQSV